MEVVRRHPSQDAIHNLRGLLGSEASWRATRIVEVVLLVITTAAGTSPFVKSEWRIAASLFSGLDLDAMVAAVQAAPIEDKDAIDDRPAFHLPIYWSEGQECAASDRVASVNS